MTSQVPHGPKEYPQFATGYAQYPPAQDHYAPSVSAPPATYSPGGYHAVAYPQEGAAGFPEPVAYPQLTLATAYPQEAGVPQGYGAVDDAVTEPRGMRVHSAHRPPEDAPHPDAYPPAPAEYASAAGSAEYAPTGYAPATSPTGYAPTADSAEYAPTGYAPATSPTGYAPTADPTGYAPTTSPTGYAPATSPTGYAPAASPTGYAPTADPAGYVPAADPAGYAAAGGPPGYAQAGGPSQAPAYSAAGGAAPSGGGYPPPSAYPTAPPWAATAQATPAPAPAHPGPPATEHGTLLVPFPDEMRNASRAHPPAVWPVTVFTLFFGFPGVISAARRAADARRGRNSTAPYWITLLVALAASAFIWFVVGAVVIKPIYDDVREDQRLAAVQDAIVHDGQLQKANLTATGAQCRAIAERDPEGMREYLCRLTLDDGRTATLTVTADANGGWVTRNSD
ncbi:hypothetical protein [Actinoplanes sp. NPDC026623]|uniref:hypothetical protein n=1 Tax=Actinoplanes sp. NPDC026623 TaxID=3155610 RepID=UPI0034053662